MTVFHLNPIMKHILIALLITASFSLKAAEKPKPAAAAWKNARNYKIITPKNYD